jgi:N-acetylglucosamine malate deacetylase 1
MTGDAVALDLLAIAAHPDDAELLCGGALIRAVDHGHRVGILDLTAGEAGSFGDTEMRRREAEEAAGIMGLAVRECAGLRDGALENTAESRAVVAGHLRRLRPSTVILHGPGGRHRDHRVARELGYDACFVAGLRRAPVAGEAFRPRKLLYALAYAETRHRATVVVDITEQMERKLEAIFAFRSQFEGRTWAGDVFGGGDRPLRDQLVAHHAHYGSWIRRPFGEPYLTRETVAVDDLVGLQPRSL